MTLTAGALQLFECSGETVTTEPPADLPVLAIVAQGAQGNVRSDGFAAAGGQGGVVGASFTLAAGTPVDVWVGCQSGWGWGTGGSRGDGKASEAYDGTNGGGSSAVFVGAGVGVVAGGGGGGGGEDFNHDDPDGVGGDGGQPAAGGHSGSGLFGTHAGGGCGGCVNAADGSGGSSSAAIALGGGGGGGGSGFLSGDGGRTKDSTNGGGGGGGTSWASDGAANVSFTTAVGEGDGYVQLTWMPGPGAAVSTYGGDRQEASPGTQFAEPLQALVTNSIGTPAVGLDVTFDLTPGGNAGTFAGQQGQVVTVQTDANGVATSPPILAGPPATGWPASAQVEVTGKTTWFALTNQGFPSTIALGLAPQPVTPGQDTGIEATVSGGANATSVPTGTVVFVVQGTSYVAPIVAGRAFLDLAPGTLTVGSSGVSASYFGDDVFGPSTTSLPLDVVPTTTTVAVTSSANPSTPGQGVTFTAAVSVATGNEQCDGCTVTFAADGVPLGTGTVDATGFATVGPITTLTDGSHTITASFDGGASYANSAGSMVQQVSAGLAVAVRVTTSPNPSQIGQAFDASVTVVPPAGGPVPTGLVTISMGGTPFCETMLTNGTADCEAAGTLLLLAGVNGITASYAGDGTYAPAAGAATQTIGLAATTTSVVPSAATVGAGQPVSFTVTVTSPFGGDLDPDGTVVLLDDGQPIAGLASVQITGGAVTTPPVTIASDGLHTISAVYQPVGTPPIWSPSIGSAQLAVVPVTTTVEVAAQAGKTLLGDAPRYVAEVKVAGQALAPEGAVLFSVNGLDRGAPVPLVDGRAASEPVAGLPTGDHDVVARFLPARGLGAASARFVHTVSQPTVVMAGASANPSRTRRRLRLRAHVGPIVPGGMLSFALDGRPIRGCQNVPVRHSTADCTTRVRKRGKHVVSVAYSGTHGHEPSTTRIEQIVRPGSKKTPRARRCARVPRPLPPEPGKCGR